MRPASTSNTPPIDLKAVRLQEIEIVADWFKNHTVLLHETLGQGDEAIEKLIWSEPKTYINRIHYLFYRNFLFVSGDLGDAVYEWSAFVSLEWLATLDLGYFGGKCRASSEEPRGKTWSPERVQSRIEEWLRQWAEDNPVDCPKCKALGPDFDDPDYRCDDCHCEGSGSNWWGTVPRPALTFEECADLMQDHDGVDLEEVICSSYAWGQFISEGDGLILSNEQKESHKDSYGRKCQRPKYSYPRFTFDSEYYNVGYTWDLRTRGHLTGLKMAWKQLQEQKSAPVL